MGDERILAVAFDGMDKDLISEYGLEHVTQTEFGQIDNHTGIKEVNTDELFASFITGTTWTEHGVTGIKSWDNPVLDKLDHILPKDGVFFTLASVGKNLLTALGFSRDRYEKDQLGCDTIFDTVNDSKSLNMPAYDVVPGIQVFSYVLDRYGIEQAEREAIKEFRQRRTEFLDEIEQNERALLMAHFHYIDSMNHLYGDTFEDPEKLEAAYREMDQFAGTILEHAAGRYDLVIFMSDHGLPTATAHNHNAFYSSNKSLFRDTLPHITDFKAVIEERVRDGPNPELDIDL